MLSLRRLILLVVICLCGGATLAAQTRYLPGYASHARGLAIDYHSPQEDATEAILVRCREGLRTMVFTTAPVPGKTIGGFIEFAWIFGVDVDAKAHRFEVTLNGAKHFIVSAPTEARIGDLVFGGPAESRLTLRTTTIDRHGDALGYAFLRVPAGRFPAGRGIEIRVTAEDASTNHWFMVFRYAIEDRIRVVAEPALMRSPKGPRRAVRVHVLWYGDPVDAVVEIGDTSTSARLGFGETVLRMGFDIDAKTRSLPVVVRAGEHEVGRATLELGPVRPFTIWLLHMSHVDIGYTHTQAEVEKRQRENLVTALRLARESAGQPEPARFRWNEEVMWISDQVVRRDRAPGRAALKAAVRSGQVELHALFGDTLTGLQSPAELFELTRAARRAGAVFGRPIRSAMLTDVPGATWALVTALARSGVRYLSFGPNFGHRTGDFLDAWGDRPFYWVSQSGEERLLCWVHEKGYSYFHSGRALDTVRVKLDAVKVFAYLSELHDRAYPYDMTLLRYNIGTDNGPPDPGLADAVAKWNETYLTPTIRIATTTEAFEAFERKYGDTVPAVRGDLTPYWEDGAATSARETAMNRAAAARLTSAETLWALHGEKPFPRGRFEDAWRQVLLFHEHTWGAWNSISEPDSPFVAEQWRVKESFALEARMQSMVRLAGAVATGEPILESNFAVRNPLAWRRSALMCVESESGVIAQESVDGAKYRRLPCQRLTNGTLAVWMADLPALGIRYLRLVAGKPKGEGRARATRHTVENDLVRIEADPKTGALARLIDKRSGRDLVDRTRLPGLNDYRYVAGRDPKRVRVIEDPVEVKVGEPGPLVASLVITSGAPGARKLTRTVTLVSGSPEVRITDRLDKERVLDPEGVHFAFPFAIDHPTVRIGHAFGCYRAEADQLPGACRNYFAAAGWADVSGRDHGVTWASPDVPLVELGDIAADPMVCGWRERVEPTATILAYPMNNYWETNYRASQEGEHVFRFSLLPHGRFLPWRAIRFAAEQQQPPVVGPARGEGPPPATALVAFDAPSITVLRCRPVGTKGDILLTLLNASEGPATLRANWAKRAGPRFWSDPDGRDRKPADDDETLPGWAVRHLVVARASE